MLKAAKVLENSPLPAARCCRRGPLSALALIYYAVAAIMGGRALFGSAAAPAQGAVRGHDGEPASERGRSDRYNRGGGAGGGGAGALPPPHIFTSFLQTCALQYYTLERCTVAASPQFLHLSLIHISEPTRPY